MTPSGQTSAHAPHSTQRIRVEPDVVVAHQAARAFRNGLLRRVAALDRRREVDLADRVEGKRAATVAIGHVDARQDVVELGHLVAPRADDAHVRVDVNLAPAGQVAIDRVGALLAVAGGLDQRRRAGHEVAAGEDAADVGRVRAGVDADAAAVDLEARLDRQERVVRCLADGRDDRVGGDLELAALYRHRRAAAGRVRLAEAVAR